MLFGDKVTKAMDMSIFLVILQIQPMWVVARNSALIGDLSVALEMYTAICGLY